MSAPRPNALVALGIALIAVAVAVLALARHPDVAPAPKVASDKRVVRKPHGPGVVVLGPKLTGFVVDGAGLPVAGADVTAELEKDRKDAAPIDVTAAPTTTADGHFELEGLQVGRYRLRVIGPGLLAAELRFVPVPSDEARIVVARQISIDGIVSDGGKPIASATVGIRGDAIGGVLEVTTDPTGAFHVPNLPEGRYQVYAWQQALAARAVRVNRLGSGPFAPIELRLEAGAIVVGRVIDRGEGTGLVAAVELRPAGDDQAPRYARSGEDGVFRIEGVPNGRWIADAFAPGFTSPGGVELDAGKGVPELALERGAAIEGRVVDSAGKPVAGATVRALTASATPIEYSADVDQDRLRRFSGRTAAPPPTSITATNDPTLIPRGELGVMIGPIPPLPAPGAQIARTSTVVDPKVATAGLVGEPPALPTTSIWTTGADGRYRIAGLPKGKLVALAIATGFAEARSAEVSVNAGELAANVEIVLTTGTFVVGTITDQHGQPVAGAEVAAQPDVGAPVESFTDESGAFKLGPVAGTIELVVKAYGHVEVHRKVELTPGGEHREDIVLEVADAVLAGSLADTQGLPVAGAHLEVVAGPGEGRSVVASSDGTFTLDMLPRGHLRVRVEHPRYPTQELDATSSTTGDRVHLVIELGGTVSGALLDGASGAALASTTLVATGPNSATADAATTTTGQWTLGPLLAGHWRVSVKQPGYLPQVRELDVQAGVTLRDIRIELARGALVGGTVRDGRGQRVRGAHVTIRSPASEASGDADTQGEFRIHDAPTGDIEISASAGDATGTTRGDGAARR